MPHILSVITEDVFHIMGRGIVWSLSMKKNCIGLNDLNIGEVVYKQGSSNAYEITGVEMSRNSVGIGDMIGLNVKRVN